MPPSTVPYIGSKISLISNSEIRYEGILYTINTQESTIALQSVRCFGTEGRKMPEIPPSSEVYDFIIFRGQDIKDLTVLEACNAVNDPAIVSINQRPSGSKAAQAQAGRAGASSGAASGKGKSSAPAGRSHGGGNAAISNIFSSYSGGSAQASQGRVGPRKGADNYGGWGSSAGYDAWGSSSGGRSGRAYDSWGAAAWAGSGWGGGRDYAWSGAFYGKGGGKGWSEPSKGKAYSKGASSKGAESSKGKAQKGKAEAGKGKAKGKTEAAKGKASGKASGKGDSGKSSSRRGGSSGATASGVPVGELVPEDNAEAKKEFAEEFDYGASNDKFAKVTDNPEGKDGFEESLKPLEGYNKNKSFFDSISCEATERSSDNVRQKMDREKARQFDKETFGDTRRPPRPTGGRLGKGRRWAGGKGK